MVDKDMLEAIGQLMDARLAPINSRLDVMEGDLQNLKADNAKLVTLEKKVDKILDGITGMNEKFTKLDQVAEDVEQIKERVFALEEASKTQASQIREWRMVK